MTYDTYRENRLIYLNIEHIWTHPIRFHKTYQDGHFPTRNITYFKSFAAFQHKLDKIHVTNDTFSGNRHIYLGT